MGASAGAAPLSPSTPTSRRSRCIRSWRPCWRANVARQRSAPNSARPACSSEPPPTRGEERAGVRKACHGARWLRRLRSEEHTSELQSPYDLVCRLLLEKKKKIIFIQIFIKKKKKK